MTNRWPTTTLDIIVINTTLINVDYASLFGYFLLFFDIFKLLLKLLSFFFIPFPVSHLFFLWLYFICLNRFQIAVSETQKWSHISSNVASICCSRYVSNSSSENCFLLPFFLRWSSRLSHLFSLALHSLSTFRDMCRASLIHTRVFPFFLWRTKSCFTSFQYVERSIDILWRNSMAALYWYYCVNQVVLL